MAAPTLDGTATAIATNVASYTVTLTTAQSNDIVCVLVYTEMGASDPAPVVPAPTIASVTASGLTFIKRSVSLGRRSAMELWWALSSSPLAAKVITINLSGAYDNTAALAFGVSGCNITGPWDSNAGLSAVATNLNTITPSFSSVNTNQANDFLIFAWGSAAAGANSIGTVPTGFSAEGFGRMPAAPCMRRSQRPAEPSQPSRSIRHSPGVRRWPGRVSVRPVITCSTR